MGPQAGPPGPERPRYDVKPLAQAIRELVPALVQLFGLIVFVATAVAWLGFGRAEPELMGIGIATATGGWLAQSLQERIAPPPRPPELGEMPRHDER